MNTMRTLYHLVRADLLERARRYSFLITLGLTILAGYVFVPPSDANYVIGVLLQDTEGLNYYRGIYNSAWIGSNVALTTTIFLSFFGFYLVKNAVERDRWTGVGQIIATTPLSKPFYTLGKALSNLAVLALMVGILGVAALVMQLIRGEGLSIQLWALSSSFLLIALPAMAVVAALAILFETLSWLRGGFGNAVYFFLWIGMSWIRIPGITDDVWGMGLIERSVTAAARAAFPDRHLYASIGVNPVLGKLQTFLWEGLEWTPGILLGRLVWVGVAFGIAMVAAGFFRRFDPAHGVFHRFDLSAEHTRRGLLDRWRKRLRPEALPSVALEEGGLLPAPARVHLTPLVATPTQFRFGRTLLAELRLMLKGQRWWWYVVALGLIVAGLSNPSDVARRQLLAFAWIWPLLIWSAMGTREVRHRTEQLVFSAAHPLRRQLPATWLAGVIVAQFAGGGVAVRFVLAGDWANVMAWTISAVFIPTLALVLGCWSGSSKLFEVVYLVVWYIGPIQGLPALDFMGVSSVSIATHVPFYYLGLTIILLGLAVVGRKRQLQI